VGHEGAALYRSSVHHGQLLVLDGIGRLAGKLWSVIVVGLREIVDHG
jgi:hypothetical protein